MKVLVCNMSHNFTNSEMFDMILIYGECKRQPRKAARVYARRYPERRKPPHNFFMRLASRLRTHGQFRPIKPAGTYLFKKFFNNIVSFYHCFYFIPIFHFLQDGQRVSILLELLKWYLMSQQLAHGQSRDFKVSVRQRYVRL